MPFTNYKTISAVLQDYQIVSAETDFVIETRMPVSDSFRADLEFSLKELVFDNSEYAICENLIYPVLKEIYKSYRDKFMLWSHQPINFDETLSGVPDYVVAKRSPLGKFVFDQPYVIVIEAKRDDFAAGWGQCLAEMVTAQKLNKREIQPVFGIVSNGKIWEFGRLISDRFTRNMQAYTIYNLEQLFAAINYIFAQCVLALEV